MLGFLAAASSLLGCVSAARAVPRPARVTALGAADFRSDFGLASAQAAFQVPCHGCLGGVGDESLFIHFEALPGALPCGPSHLRLNGHDLLHHGHTIHANGSESLPVRGRTKGHRAVALDWEINCLTNDTSIAGLPADDSALVLTVTVSQLDSRAPRSLSGFTASFRQFPTPEILRLELTPVSPAPQSPAEDWRNPPSHLRLDQLLSSKLDVSHVLEQRLRELEALKAQSKELKQLIKAKEEQLRYELQQNGQDLEYELSECESLECAFEALSQRIKNAFKFAYYRITSTWEVLDGSDKPRPQFDMHADTLNSHHSVRPPAPAHLPPPSESEISSYGSYEKLPDEHTYTHANGFRPHGKPRRHPIVSILHFILVAFGLIALAAFVRRRCASLRTRTERAANREERRNRRAFRRAARRAAWRNWWRSGWGRRRDQARRTDYEEKRALIQEQESRLEGAMADEIQRLQQGAMADEIQNLRHAHGFVDELVRAEEGRGTLARPVIIRGRMPGMASIAGVMMDQDLYSTSHLSGSTAVSETDDGSAILTPPTSATFSHSMSRSNSLPSYRTDPTQHSVPSSRFGGSDIDAGSIFSDPPAYQTDPDDSDDDTHSRGLGAVIVTNGFTRYTPSEYAASLLSPTDTASIFTPESSIPDVSTPRMSADTVRTFI